MKTEKIIAGTLEYAKEELKEIEQTLTIENVDGLPMLYATINERKKVIIAPGNVSLTSFNWNMYENVMISYKDDKHTLFVIDPEQGEFQEGGSAFSGS